MENLTSKQNLEKDKQVDYILQAIEKIRDERTKAENKIYEAIKEFEWSTGIKTVKLDFETSRDKMDSRVKIVLERI